MPFRASLIAALTVLVFTPIGATVAKGLAYADPGASGNNTDPNADKRFFDLLTGYPEDPDNMTIFDYPLVKSQALHACQLETNGTAHTAVVDALAAVGYRWEDAENIVVSAEVIYCPWNNPPDPDPDTPPPPPGPPE
jgi:hypothetical protein